MKKLFISEKAIEKLGYNFFLDLDVYNFVDEIDTTTEYGYSVYKDDMEDIYVYVDEADEDFIETDDLIKEYRQKLLVEKSEIFSMRAICELADVPYQTFRTWKAKGYGLSDERVLALLTAMKNAVDVDFGETTAEKIASEIVGEEMTLLELDNDMEQYNDFVSALDHNGAVDLLEDGNIAYTYNVYEFEGILVWFDIVGEPEKLGVNTLLKITSVEEL